MYSYLIFQVLIIEFLHTFGVSLLIFRVLPSMDSVHGLMILSATCLIPGMNKIFLDGRRVKGWKNRSRLCFVKFVDFLAVCIQVGALVVIIGTDFGSDVVHSVYGNSPNSTMTNVNTASKSPSSLKFQLPVRIPWEAPVALILISLQWWENFAHRNIQLGLVNFNLETLKSHLQQTRVNTEILSSIWKLCWTIGFANVLDVELTNIFSDQVRPAKGYENWSLYVPAIIQICCALLCYYFATVACKLRMQRLGFALPLSIAPLLGVGLMRLECHADVKWKPSWYIDTVFKQLWTCDASKPLEHYAFAGVWIISFLWIGRHIWFPSVERLARTDRYVLSLSHSLSPPFHAELLLHKQD